MAWKPSGWGSSSSSKPSTSKKSAPKTYVNKKYGYTPAKTSSKASVKKGGSSVKLPTNKGPGSVSSYDNAWHPASWYAPKANDVKKPSTKGNDFNVGGAKLPNGKKANVNSYFGTPISTNKNSYNGGKKIAPKAIKPVTTTTTTTSKPTSVNSSGGGGGGTGVAKPAVAAPKPAVPAKPAAPKPTTTTPSKPTTASNFTTLRGYGTSKKFNTRRRGGPRQSLSITPDMLQRIAQQRIVRYS